MAGLVYVGPSPTLDREVSPRVAVEAALNTGVSRSYVDGRVDTLSAGKATKVYIDTQDSLYADAAYPATKDALLVPVSSKGQPNGVASLDSGGKVPTAQVPVMGAGIIGGPYGHTTGYGGTTAGTPMKIADFPSGVIGINCQLLIFMSVIAIAALESRPVVEVRYSTTGNTTYAGQTLVAAGYGETFLGDAQTISVMPVAALGEGQDGIQDTISAASNLTITAWLYDGVGSGATVSTQVGYIVSAAMYLARTTL